MICIGIDPGKLGGFAAVDDAGQVVTVVPIPTVRVDGRDEYNLPAIRLLFEDLPRGGCFITIEKPQPIPPMRGHDQKAMGGFMTNFQRGLSRGLWVGLLVGLGFGPDDYQLVAPPTWQKVALAGIPGADTKSRSILAAKNRWTKVDLRRSERSRIESDGLADALHLAEYGRRTLMGGEVFAAAARA